MEIPGKLSVGLEELSGKLYDIGAIAISSIVFTTNNPRDLEDQAINKALVDAQMRAQKMADASGARLGRLVSMNGQQTQAVGTITRETNKLNDITATTGQIEITRTLTLVYELN